MKRIVRPLFIIAVLSVMVAFTACSVYEPPTPVLDFSADICITAEGFNQRLSSIEAKLNCTSQGAMSVSVTSPDELETLTYKWTDTLEMSYCGLLCKANIGYITDSCFAEAVYNVICDLRQAPKCTDYSDGVATFSGECQSGTYQVITDSSGYIQNISIEEINLSADFICKQT